MTEDELTALSTAIYLRNEYRTIKANIIKIGQDYNNGIITAEQAGETLQRMYRDLPKAAAIGMFQYVVGSVQSLIDAQQAILDAANITVE